MMHGQNHIRILVLRVRIDYRTFRNILTNSLSTNYEMLDVADCRSQWPRCLRRSSTAARLLRSWVWIPPRAWMFVCCECCVLSGRGLCDGLIIRSEGPYRLWRVVVCDHETSQVRRLKPARGLWNTNSDWGCSARRERERKKMLQIKIYYILFKLI